MNNITWLSSSESECLVKRLNSKGGYNTRTMLLRRLKQVVGPLDSCRMVKVSLLFDYSKEAIGRWGRSLKYTFQNANHKVKISPLTALNSWLHSYLSKGWFICWLLTDKALEGLLCSLFRLTEPFQCNTFSTFRPVHCIYRIHGAPEKTKHCGVSLDDQLKWKEHTKKLRTRCFGAWLS